MRRSLFGLSLLVNLCVAFRICVAFQICLEFQPALAAEPPNPAVAALVLEPLALPLELNLLQPGAIPTDPTIVTSRLANQERSTIPSLWWAQSQFGDSLLTDWLAYPGSDGTPQRVDLVVNAQAWSIYTYVERYTFVNHLGTSAADYGYNSRVFNPQGELLAAYICDFDTANAATGNAVVNACTVFLASDARTSLTGRPRTGAGSATPAGTGSP